ncbi:MAG TPA: response regulator [Roseiflexaceae bacterium]|jgi:DNA-binding response OmpR family regulator|nr:response regulator [Roseiflexaceae bacterium]
MATHIMIIDDEPAIGKLLMYQLQTLGYSAMYMQDGLLALQQFERQPPDLVLLDVMMPRISGWDVCRQMRTHSSVPIIMLTAKNADADVVTGLTAGADDYIGKPFSMTQLHARIEAVLRRSQRARRTASRSAGEPAEHAAHAEPAPHVVEATTAAMTQHESDASVPRVRAAPIEAQASRTRLGPLLRQTRLAKGLSLHQIGSECHIHWEFLQAIEQENFSYVPRKQLHMALHAYSNYLGLNLHELVGRPAAGPPTHHQWTRQYGFAVLAIFIIVLSIVVLSIS